MFLTVAPLASLNKDIADVLTVLKEGRCAMASTMAAYKNVIMYCLSVSYCSLIMYAKGVSFSDFMWIAVDVFWTVVFTLTIPLAKASDTISMARPPASLLSLQTVGSVMGIIAINYLFMMVAFFVLFSEDWFQCRQLDTNALGTGSILSLSDHYDTSVLFLMAGAQIITAAIAFSFGYKYRQAWFRNYRFAVPAVGYAIIHIFITLVPGSISCFYRINCDNDHIVRGVLNSEPIPIGNPYNTTIMPMEFRLKLLGVMMANALFIIAYEYFVVNGLWQRRYEATLAKSSIKNVYSGEDKL
jgi:magnesium-transporting ATPase (P-type)